ncbi:cobalt/nickel transport system ATP-binding protein [Oikeobacillus pervagus]|uniref:ABC transporter ATP-binding protein n=1 Tax=Oikeobacillus pervagus TaxID=1325931 RepID=A0AAJ1T1J7_9BACI|nr:ATP-binding cassette domain-containing protein [Oikeobacillus pervagus]MDQ0214239.1 cobalt/nickel transport system ATP-binding protein [Oikeobacillus pervagus]
MTVPILQLENLSFSYPDRTNVLKNINLSFSPGRKIAVLGNNGAGKSTLFLHLNGLLRPKNGTVYFKGQPLKYKKKELVQLRKSVGLVFQQADSQIFASTVRDDVAFGPKNLGLAKEEIEQYVDEALRLTEMTNYSRRPPHLLSIGEKKRVAIAGVLAMKPEVIVLDEPTAGLDLYYSDRLLHILSSIHQNGTTIILSTHDVDFAYEWSDEIIIMNNGETLYSGDGHGAFSDEGILSRSHLHKPWILDIVNQFEEIPSHADFPKSRDQLLHWLSQKIGRK